MTGEQDESSGPTAGSHHTVPAVDIDNVAVRLGDVDALSGVSVSVEHGCFLGVIGPNGSGKTTLLRTISAALAPDAGRVRLAGDDAHDLPSREVSRRVAVVPQDTSLAFDFEVRELVAMGRTPYLSRFSRGDRADRLAVARAMERTDVDQFSDRAVSALSGGERQRVLLARAIAQDTPVLLLDEPTASLDINHQIRTLELVTDLVDDGKTVIAAIHDLELAARYCRALLLLHDGKVMACGDPESVLTTEHVQRAFDIRSVVTTHPVTGTRQVTPLPDA